MMMILSQDQATTITTETKMTTEKSTLNILLDDAVSISEKLAAMKCSASCTKSLRSGSHTDIGARRSNEDQHIHIDDVAKHPGKELQSKMSNDHSTANLLVTEEERRNRVVTLKMVPDMVTAVTRALGYTDA
ncbi:hypothetical protein Tco_1419583 [Tanacetum coccineum]